MIALDEMGLPLLVEGIAAQAEETSMNMYVHGAVHPVKFEGRERTHEQHLTNVIATVYGAAKLVERARTGDPAESASNASCAASWLRIAAAELEALE